MAAPTLLILPGLDGADAILASAGQQGYQTSRLSELNFAKIQASDLHIILPGQLVRIFETEIPKAGRAQQLKMARFAKEDDIANGSESLHFALSDSQPPRIAVVDIEVMDRLIKVLGALRPKAVYADYDLLQGETAIQVIDRVVEPGIAALDLDWTQEPLVKLSDTELASRFAEGIASGRGLNLLQGEYRAQSKFALPTIPTIRFGALAAAGLIAAFLWNAVQDRSAMKQAQDLRAATAAEYLSATGQRAPSNPGRTAARSVQSSPSATHTFLDLSSILFESLANMDDIRVDQLRYSEQDGTLRLRLIYPSFDAASRVEIAVARAGGILTTGGVREQDGAFVGEATLSTKVSS